MSTCQKPSFGLNKFISLYLKDISKFKQCLSAEEERQLFNDIQKGNHASFDKLFLSWQYIVFEEVLYFSIYSTEITELIQEANLACLIAMQNYNPEKGNTKNYLHHHIYRHLDTFIKSNFSVIKYPLNVVTEMEKIRGLLNEGVILSESDLDYSNFESKISESVDRTEFSFVFFDNSFTYLLESFSDRVDIYLDDSLLSHYEDPDSILYWQSLQKDISFVLSNLSPQKVEIICHYFGLSFENSYTLQEIGEKLGLTRERIRQILRDSLAYLNEYSHSKPLSDYFSFLYTKSYKTVNYKTYFFNLTFEDNSFAVEHLSHFVKPFRRSTSYPEIENQSAECRRLVKQFLSEAGKPMKEEDLKYLILEIYPEITPSIISYGIKTASNVIKIAKGTYALDNWGYFPYDSSTSYRFNVKIFKEKIISLLQQQSTPISFNYLLSKLTELMGIHTLSPLEEKKIIALLEKSDNIIKTLDQKYYYLNEE